VYAKKGQKHPRPGDGLGTNLITLDSGFTGVPDDTWLQTMLPKARIAFRSNSPDVQARMCALGRGIAVLPQPLAERTPGITVVDLGGTPPPRDTWMGYHRGSAQAKTLARADRSGGCKASLPRRRIVTSIAARNYESLRLTV
jgi:DNA-binding transcriptional LysR family regulator